MSRYDWNGPKPVRLDERGVAELKAATEMAYAVARAAAPGKDLRELCRRLAAVSAYANGREGLEEADGRSYFELISALMEPSGIKPY